MDWLLTDTCSNENGRWEYGIVSENVVHITSVNIVSRCDTYRYFQRRSCHYHYVQTQTVHRRFITACRRWHVNVTLVFSMDAAGVIINLINHPVHSIWVINRASSYFVLKFRLQLVGLCDNSHINKELALVFILKITNVCHFLNRWWRLNIVHMFANNVRSCHEIKRLEILQIEKNENTRTAIKSVIVYKFAV